MIKHIVAFRFSDEVDGATRESILRELGTFPARYPNMRNWSLGRNVSERDSTMSHVFTVEFARQEELDSYLRGAPHESFVRERWRPVIARQTIVTLDTDVAL
jgi:2,3-dihydroxy-p-cumate/2,3-dihydroxybenzoate 3,4-dioxygenase